MIFRLLVLAALVLPVATGAGAQPFTSSNLPIFVISTGGRDIPDEPKITAHLGVVWNGDGQRNALTDAFNHYNGAIGVELRGSTSQSLSPKKPYSIETRDAAGEDQDVALLGLPKESDWVLIAPYSDKSLMRDVLAYEIARRTGQYASRTRFVELVLNGQYMGVYVLAEKIKRDKNRVDMANLKTGDIEGEEVTGGYLLKFDKTTGGEVGGWTLGRRADTGHSIFVQYHDPKPSEIQPQQAAYIQNWIGRFEAMLTAPDMGARYQTWIDTPSWISFLVTNEVSRNVDGYRLSSYFWKEKDDGDVPGRLFMGPVWDFNLGFGNANYYDGDRTDGWQADFREAGDGAQPPFWWRVVRADPAFRAALGTRWQALRRGPLHTDSLVAFVQAQKALLDEAQRRNYVRWPVLNDWVWPNAYVGGTYANEVNYLETWLRSRLAWLDANMPAAATAAMPEAAPGALSLAILPQPARSQATLALDVPAPGRARVAVYDLLGRAVAQPLDGPVGAGPFTLALDTQAWAPGVYLVQAQVDGQTATARLVKVP